MRISSSLSDSHYYQKNQIVPLSTLIFSPEILSALSESKKATVSATEQIDVGAFIEVRL